MKYRPDCIPGQFQGSKAKYKAFTSGAARTIPEIAAHMGYTYAGCRSSVLRMVARKELKEVPQPKGLVACYIWSGK